MNNDIIDNVISLMYTHLPTAAGIDQTYVASVYADGKQKYFSDSMANQLVLYPFSNTESSTTSELLSCRVELLKDKPLLDHKWSDVNAITESD